MTKAPEATTAAAEASVALAPATDAAAAEASPEAPADEDKPSAA